MSAASSLSSPPRETSRKLQAVFWDMDGTLVDTEPYWIAAEYDLVISHGGTWSEEQASMLVGQALDYSAGLLQSAGVDMSVREIIDTLIARVVEQVRSEIPWRPGARELLDDLSESGVRSALVTMSEKPLAQEIVSALPAGQLEFIVSGDMVERGKPDPEAYLTAFARMAQDHPEPLERVRCLAIEDSVPGTAAAADSGITTLAVPHFSPLPESDRWHVLPTLQGLDVAGIEELISVSPASAATMTARHSLQQSL